MAKAKTRNSEVTSSVETVSENPIPETVSKSDYEKLLLENRKLQEKINELLTARVSTPVNRMDTLCTVIHLRDCFPNLPTTVKINGVTHFFTNFGETKMFRWQDLSTLIAVYRDFFTRGVLALGADCDVFKNEIPSDLMRVALPPVFYNEMASMPLDKFEYYLNQLNASQRVQVATTWRHRYMSKKNGYRDIEKIKVLSKATDGSLKDLLVEILGE